ncbi:MAG: efflux RND transporter permease subunit [Pseudomonadota bacterium]
MDPRFETQQTGIIAWFASNHVAANLLMLLILAFGIVSTFSIRVQTFPDFELNKISVRVPYPGAAPAEVEEGVVIKVEEAIQDISGIKQIQSTASEGLGSVSIDVEVDEDLNEILNEVKTRVDAISTFPGLTEKPVIYKQEVPTQVLFVALHGEMDEYARKALAQTIRDELMNLSAVNGVEILGDRDYEISIEVSEQALREYGLTLSEISRAVRNSSVDLPGGTIRTDGGDILLRTEGQVYTGTEYADIVLRNYPDGTRLLLRDVAEVRDGFVERDGFGRFDGMPTATLRVQAIGEQNELETAEVVKAYVADRAASLPTGVYLDVWVDNSHYLQERLDMMLKNMFSGVLLVIIVLALFLRMKVALWVIVGIPLAFFGALWLMPITPWSVSISMISLFAFILVLGIVVDDAIIIGESIYTSIRADGHTLDNVVSGARRVAVPATFGVLTTVAAFAPMLFVGTTFGPFFESMSVVVILCLLFSLVESKLILPAHLAHARIKDVDEARIFAPLSQAPVTQWLPRLFQRLNRYVQHGLQRLIHNIYEPLVERAIAARGVTATLFLAALIVTFGLINSGLVRQVLIPEISGDFVSVRVEMEPGTPPALRNRALDRIEQSALDMNSDWLADNPGSLSPINHLGVFTEGETVGLAFAEMPLSLERPMTGGEVEERWRERVGEMPGVKELSMEGGGRLGGGSALNFILTGPDYERLAPAAADLQAVLASYEGVFDIKNSLTRGGNEIRLAIKPEAEALGLTMADLGQQVRQAFYGEEAQRIQRGKDELKVMIRYPESERKSVYDLENMRIRTPNGDEVPFEEVATLDFGQAYSSIRRQDRLRAVTVSADVNFQRVEPRRLIGEIQRLHIPVILANNPGVNYALDGASLEEQDFMRNVTIASAAAMFLIYALIAIPLRSYSQPLIIMSVIPFGLIGAVIGHLVLGLAISMFSIFGLIALAGVVVNDSIIMVDFINKARDAGIPPERAVVQSGTQRFRAIILTSLTTAAGLVPIMFETSVQAQFVIPMAVSMAFGILFATVITLFLVPSLYLLQLDFRAGSKRLWHLLIGRQPTSTEASA